MRDEAQRQLLAGDDGVAHDIGQRHLGGRDQVEVLDALAVFAADLARHLEQVFLELGQLAGAAHRGGVDHVRHVHLGVAVFLRMGVEHQLDQRAVHARQAAAQHREARTGDLDRGVEVQAQLLAHVDVVAHCEVELARLAHAAHLGVLGLVIAHRHAFVRQVGDRQHQFGQMCLDLIEPRGRGLERVADAADFCHHGRGVLAFALEHADLLGQAVAARLQFLGLGLQLLAFGLKCLERRNVELVAARGKALRHGVDVFAEQLDVEHVA
ncbi:hypothetical protein D3C72_1481570 [compost metagenome]